MRTYHQLTQAQRYQIYALRKTKHTLEDFAPVIELYHHMVWAGNLDEAVKLFYNRLNEPLYYQLGAYQVFIELESALFDEKTQLPRLRDEGLQARVINDIDGAYAMSGQPRRVVQALQMVIAIDEKNNNKSAGAVFTLGNIATQQLVIGALSAAERNLHHAIELDKENEDKENEGSDNYDLGRVLAYCGKWSESGKRFDTAEQINTHKSYSSAKCYLVISRPAFPAHGKG